MQQHVAPAETLGAAGAVSQIVATNVVVVPPDVSQMLDGLADIRAEIEKVAQAKQTYIDSLLDGHASTLSAYDAQIAPLSARAVELENAIKAAVASGGKTVKASSLQAVWAAGRVSWDSKGLEGVAVVMPEILKFRKVGEPSVSIRPVGGAK